MYSRVASMHTVVVCILILLATIDAYYGIKYPYSFLVVATLVVVLMYARMHIMHTALAQLV